MPAYDEGDGDPSNRVQYLRTIVDFHLMKLPKES